LTVCLQVANFADVFTSRGLSEIPPALEHLLQALLKLPKLHTVNLSDNAFGLNTIGPLTPFLANHTPLEHLYLNNNGLGPQAGTLVATSLAELGKKKKAAGAPELKTVICGRNRLENGSMEAWAIAYENNTGVTEIKMVQNGIRQEGITHLLKNGLRHLQNLKTLDLQDNTFTAMGARALGDVVGGWTKIVELGVGDSLLGARGGVMLGEALQKGNNTVLEVLRLQYNEIDYKGLKSLSLAVEHLPALRRIELNGNKFSEDDESLDVLREALNERKEKAGVEDDEDENWGIDELDELEEASDDEEEEAEEEEEERETVLKQADEAEEANVSQKDDKDVNKLADLLGKSGI